MMKQPRLNRALVLEVATTQEARTELVAAVAGWPLVDFFEGPPSAILAKRIRHFAG